MKTIVCDASYNEQLKKIASVPVPGSIVVRYLREKDFFKGTEVQGETNTVIATLEGDEIAATVTRSLKRVYVNNNPMTLGYLSGLRVLPPFRGKMHFAAGYRFLRNLDNNLAGIPYLCTLIRGNTHALQTLTRPRKGLLHFYFLDHFHTYSLFIPGKTSNSTSNVKIRYGHEMDREDIIHFLQEEGQKKQFFPVYDKQAFEGYLSTFDFRNLHLLTENGKIIGTAGIWDQSDYKQVEVLGYSSLLSFMRPIINVFLKGVGLSRLPAPPGKLKMAYLSFIAVRDNNPALMNILLSSIISSLGMAGYHFLLACLCKRDNLNRVFRRRFHIRYDSDLYLAAWEKNPSILSFINKRKIFYLELGTL